METSIGSAAGEATAREVKPEQTPASQPKEQGEMAWGPAPDAFIAGTQLCVLHGDPFAPGSMFTVRLRATQRCVFAPHSHPHDEHLTIVSGRLDVGGGPTLDRTNVRSLGPGDYVYFPRDQFHYAWAMEDDTVFQVHAIGPFGITYANPEDDPRNASSH